MSEPTPPDPKRGREQRDPVEAPELWKRSPDVWRFASRLSPKRIDLYLRLRTARQIPRSFRARFAAMRLSEETVDRVLGEVRGLDDWMGAWNRAAQRFLSEARREETAGRSFEAAVARRQASMCYHAAHFVTDTDPRTVRALKAAGVAAFAQAVPRLMPETRRVAIPWRTSQLPAYFAKPLEYAGPHPLVVLFNGATTTKEELLLWADAYLERGIAVLTVDWPGTGEATHLALTADCDDVTDGLLDFAYDQPDLDPEAIVLLGFSLGGSVAIRAAAFDRRVGACIAVTPPYEPRTWIHYVNPIVRQQLMQLARDPNWVDELLQEFSLGDVIPKLRSPLLVFGAGRDLVVPPEESLHLASAAGELATLVWYRRGSYGLYETLDDWSHLAADWITSMYPPSERIATSSTRVDEELPNVVASPADAAPPDLDPLEDFEDDEKHV